VHELGGPLPNSGSVESSLFAKMKEDFKSRNPTTDSSKDFAPHDPPDFASAIYSHALTEKEKEDFEQGKKMMYVLGFIKWTDGAGTHEWRLCAVLPYPGKESYFPLHNCYTHNNYLQRAAD
jgi:hypothetical protein